MDKITLFNELIPVVTPLNSNGAKAESLDQPLPDTGLDSLDLLMMAIYLGDVYGLSEENLKGMQPVTISDMFSYMEEHKTKPLPETVEEALSRVQ